MKVLSNKEISFASRIRQGWTKERLMSHYNLDEKRYQKLLDDIRRIEANDSNILPTPKSEDTSLPIIHIYSPEQWHDEAAIIMNENGRKKLIEALQSGAKKIVIPAFVTDGEGFFLYVQILPQDEIDKYRYPYTADICRGSQMSDVKEPKYQPTAEEQEQIAQGKDAGGWKAIT